MRALPTFIGPSFSREGRLVKKINDFQFNLTVAPNTSYSIVDTASEDPGELQGFRVSTNRPELIMQVTVYGDSPSPDIVNSFTMQELLARGAGMTPGDAEVQPQQRSKDPTGQANGLFPWLARYKDETFADYLGYEDRRIVLMYTPNIYDTYNRLVVNLVNTSTMEPALVQEITVRRLAYQDSLTSDTPPRVGNRGEFSNASPTVVPQTSNMDYDTDPTPAPTKKILYDELA
jgi:hypothetical protein